MKLLSFGLCLLVALCCLVQPSVQQDDSCVGKCEQGLVDGAPCQCNESCLNFGDCCDDYEDECLVGLLTCEDRCDIGYDYDLPCQCNSECPEHGNCCADFDDFCDGGSSGGSVSNSQLLTWSQNAILIDANNCGTQYTLDIGGETAQCSSSDQSPNPFFATFDETIWDKDTIFLLRELFDNYERDVGTVEDHTLNEQAEESVFLDAVMASDVMIDAYNFLNTNGVFPGTIEEFRAKIEELWFVPYDRDGTSADVKGSSGFEHVFMGEIKEGGISGFHNWLHWYYEEQAGNINYLGWLDTVTWNPYGDGITNVFSWYGYEKCIGGNFVGTSPELDLATYTVCFLTRGGSSCNLEWNGVPFNVVTYDLIQDGVTHIGTAYPEF